VLERNIRAPSTAASTPTSTTASHASTPKAAGSAPASAR
jgi:hypothetical protein